MGALRNLNFKVSEELANKIKIIAINKKMSMKDLLKLWLAEKVYEENKRRVK